MPIIVDAHEDIAWNIQTWNRDYTRSAADTWKEEADSSILNHSENSLLGWEDYQQGRVAVIFSTLFVSPARKKLGDWDTQAYKNFDEAHLLYRAQIAKYHLLTNKYPDKFRLIRDVNDFGDILDHWNGPEKNHPVGLVILMEGAEGVRKPSELEDWWFLGVRIIGPAWAGTRFCGGTREPGPLTDDGRELLAGMAEIGMTLDVSHMDELAAFEALDDYPRAVIASHANCASLLENYSGNRMLSDEMIKKIIQRNGIIGLVPTLPFLKFDWKKADGRDILPFASVFSSHIDHICQIAGNSDNVGLGTDFDGGFGVESVPSEINTIADLQILESILSSRGYSPADIEKILGKNWMQFLQKNLPE